MHFPTTSTDQELLGSGSFTCTKHTVECGEGGLEGGLEDEDMVRGWVMWVSWEGGLRKCGERVWRGYVDTYLNQHRPPGHRS